MLTQVNRTRTKREAQLHRVRIPLGLVNLHPGYGDAFMQGMSAIELLLRFPQSCLSKVDVCFADGDPPPVGPDNLPNGDQSALRHLPISGDRKRSPPKVSRKREYYGNWLETFWDFSPTLPKFAIWRRNEGCRKTPILRDFHDFLRTI